MSGIDKQNRENALNTIIKNITIDTCCAFDTNIWETGINKNNNWVIVEQYSSEEKAKNGHKQWVKNIIKNPDLKLKDINIWGIV